MKLCELRDRTGRGTRGREQAIIEAIIFTVEMLRQAEKTGVSNVGLPIQWKGVPPCARQMSLPMGCTAGVANASLKGEDRSIILKGGATKCSLAAVFDGHGGTIACTHGISKLAPAVQSLGLGAAESDLADAFWEADQALGAKCTDGSTATILLTDGVQCMLLWVGDSQACAAQLAPEGASILANTTCHVATDDAERLRLEHTWQISRKWRLAAAERAKANQGSEVLPPPPTAPHTVHACTPAPLTLAACASLCVAVTGATAHCFRRQGRRIRA